MRKAIHIILTLTLTLWLVSFSQAPPKEDASDEKAIRDISQHYQAAYNQRDAAKLTALWDADATYFNPVTGETAQGRQAIEELYKEKFRGHKDRTLSIETSSIELLNEGKAIEKGLMKLQVAQQPAVEAAFQLEYIKENGKWSLSAIKEIELQEPHSNYEQLKPLAWLIGKWEDRDDNVQIMFENSWDKHKNFIIANFIMKIYGQDDMEGKQIIAWDPVKEQIRSWVFDSDGGFGDGTWEKSGNSWYATMRYTLADGRIASVKNIYTPINNTSYTFAAVERDVDGEILPDTTPVVVEKIEEQKL